MNDLKIAKSLISEDGIILIDDYYNMDWPGVKTAVDNWLMQNKDYVCFYATHSILMLCKKDFYQTIKQNTSINKKDAYNILHSKESNKNINSAVTAGIWTNELEFNNTIGLFSLFGRCGSTSLSEALYINIRNCGHLLTEPFSPLYDNWGSYKDSNIKIPKPSIQNIEEIIKQYRIRIIKTLEHDLEEDENIMLLNLFSKKIFLFRHNFVDYFASKWMSSNFEQKTKKRLWYCDHIKSDEDFFNIVRDPIPIQNMISQYVKYKEKLKMYLDEVKFDCIIDYESLYANSFEERKNTFINLCDWSKIQLKKELDFWPLSTDRKHNSYENYEKLIPNWKEVFELRKHLILSKD